jgi:hypothetical protein
MIENTTNTGFDLATTLFSALATAFRPLSTVHGLTAAASVSGGWKTAIDSDIYSKASAANYVQIIQGSYYQDMPAFMASLEAEEKKDRTSVDPLFALGNIRRIHVECSLEAAQAKLAIAAANAANTPPQAVQASTSVILKVSVVGAAKAGDALTLTASDLNDKPVSSSAIAYTVKAGDTASQIAQALYAQVTGGAAASDLKKAGVTAALLPAPLNDSIILTWPAGANIQWKPSTQASELLTISPWSGPSLK